MVLVDAYSYAHFHGNGSGHSQSEQVDHSQGKEDSHPHEEVKQHSCSLVKLWQVAHLLPSEIQYLKLVERTTK